MKSNRSNSWNKVSGWYNKITANGGHYFHRQVIIPNVLRLLNLEPQSIQHKASYNVLDLACGNGVLAKSLPKTVKYTGVDSAENLIKKAKLEDKNYSHKYLIADVTHPLSLTEQFTHAVIILALQNLDRPEKAIENAYKALNSNGYLLIVINHPMFRIPRQSSWGMDDARKIQYRRIDRYITPMAIPVNMNPSDRNSEITMSYHYPLTDYTKMLKAAGLPAGRQGFVIELIEEWTSDKESFGRAKKMEDRARAEIPLFMAIVAQKIS